MDKDRTHEACQHSPRPIAAMASSHPDGELIAPHHHPRAQLVHAIAGVMTVTSPPGSWVVPSGRAVWMPAGIDHAIRVAGQVEMRTVFVAPDARPDLPRDCQVIEVSALLRALVVSATRIPFDYDVAGRDGRISGIDPGRGPPGTPVVHACANAASRSPRETLRRLDRRSSSTRDTRGARDGPCHEQPHAGTAIPQGTGR